MGYATTLLSEKLHTKVSIDSVYVGFFSHDIGLYGVDVEDQQQRKMLQMKRLSVDMNWLSLLKRQVVVEDLQVDDLSVILGKPSKDAPANYQFVIDAFKKDSVKTGHAKEASPDSTKNFSLDLSRVRLRDIKVRYNETEATLGQVDYRKNSTEKVVLKDFAVRWESESKKGPVSRQTQLGLLSVAFKDSLRPVVQLSDLRYSTDNHKARRNSGKPKRGAFDVGHLDLTAHLRVEVDYFSKDSLHAILKEGRVEDAHTGFNIHDFQFIVAASRQKLHFTDIRLCQDSTFIAVEHADFCLPNKAEGRTLSYRTGKVTAKVILKDISKPFAPVLKKFVLPLHLSTSLRGNADGMDFHQVSVNTSDKKLALTASGNIRNMKDKHQLAIRFHVNHMKAKTGIKTKIISQFPVKKFMMKQLHALGDIDYTGDFAVLWKKERFKGSLHTRHGVIAIEDLTLDEDNKYVFGKVSSARFDVSKVLDMDDLGPVACTADFKFDISKSRTALMRRRKGGKLPIGKANIFVSDVHYKILHFRDVEATLESDGAIAVGQILQKGKIRDIYCSYSFTNTEQMHKMKVKPGIKFHKKRK